MPIQRAAQQPEPGALSGQARGAERAAAERISVSAAVAGVGGSGALRVSQHTEASAGSGTYALVITAAGAVDLDTEALLRNALLDAVAVHRTVCVDLGGITFFGAVGANALVAARNAATLAGRTLLVRGVPGVVRRTLELTELDRVFAIEA